MPRRIKRLPGDVEEVLASGRGLLVSGSAARRGITRPRIQRLARSGLLTRVARGIYTSAEEYADADSWGSFTIRSRAFAVASGPHAVAAGWSAAAIRGLPAISPPPQRPLVYLPKGCGSNSDDVFGRVRVVELAHDDRAEVNGYPVTSLPRTVVDLARSADRDEALVVADAALAAGVSRDALAESLGQAWCWPGVGDAEWVLRHADPYAESALETLGRLAFIEGDLPVPISNAWIDLGPVTYRPDHLDDELWQIREADGAVKYDGRRDASRVIDRQREREWHLREAGFEIGRYGWKLARYDRPQLVDRFRAMRAARTARPQRARWYRDPLPYRLAS